MIARDAFSKGSTFVPKGAVRDRDDPIVQAAPEMVRDLDGRPVDPQGFGGGMTSGGLGVSFPLGPSGKGDGRFLRAATAHLLAWFEATVVTEAP